MSASDTALICGSFAYDHIMVFADRFKNHILPEKVHMLSVSFLVPQMRKEFGGCAGNIAYSLSLLGGKPEPMGTVGKDFAPYGEWMDQCGISRRHVAIVEEEFTAQAFITTDLDDNQITAFHPGAMNMAHINNISDAERPAIGIVSPDGRDGMLAHAAQFADLGIPFIFDPGQGLPMFDGADLNAFIEQATWLAVNDYEWSLVEERTGLSPAQVADRLEALIVTRGAQGSQIYTRDKVYDLPVAPAAEVVDPTGCGDAYRAGLLYGLTHDMDWETTGRMASLLGSLKIATPGTQNHSFERAQFDEMFKDCFGYAL
jgi:adenosine kinase